MSNKYLLPCPCGRQTVIEARQAGQTVTCECGASIPTPTLMEMRSLEPAPLNDWQHVATSVWGLRQGLWMAGIVLLLVGLGSEVWLLLHPPISRFDVINPEQVQQSYKSLPAARTWEVWQRWKQGLDRRTDQQYAAALQRFHIGQIFAAGIALAGVALMVAGARGRRRLLVADRSPPAHNASIP